MTDKREKFDIKRKKKHVYYDHYGRPHLNLTYYATVVRRRSRPHK